MIKIKNYYHKFEKIGEGAYSEVYKGYNNNIKNKNYAIKVIDIDKNKNNIDRFHVEIELMKKLNHKNIVTLYDTFQNDKYIYIIMEYCKYGDLRNFLKGHSMNEFKIHIIMKQLINGLQYLFENKVFHRDLKPHNILISNNCIIKIADFGLAKQYDENNLSDTICGSPIYMAPEIICKNKYNNKADIWSLGVIFYELITGHSLFNVKKYSELVNAIKTKDIKISSKLKISENGRDLLIKLLKKKSCDRITWEQIFKHSWVTGGLTNSILFKSKINRISNNNRENKSFILGSLVKNNTTLDDTILDDTCNDTILDDTILDNNIKLDETCDDCMFQIEINESIDNNIEKIVSSYNEYSSDDLDYTEPIDERYDMINESFSAYDESLEFIQNQNKTTIKNDIYNYFSNSSLYVKSLVSNIS